MTSTHRLRATRAAAGLGASPSPPRVQENKEKMARGMPLTDADRWPWLDTLAGELAARPRVVLACSALRRVYRDRLRAAGGGVRFLFITGPPDVIHERMLRRSGHFMPPSLLQSQLATLEPPAADEASLTVPLGLPLAEQVGVVLQGLGLGQRASGRAAL
jgi:gluconokinase